MKRLILVTCLRNDFFHKMFYPIWILYPKIISSSNWIQEKKSIFKTLTKLDHTSMPSISGSNTPISPPAAVKRVGSQSVTCIKSVETRALWINSGLQIKATLRMPPSKSVSFIPRSGKLLPQFGKSPDKIKSFCFIAVKFVKYSNSFISFQTVCFFFHNKELRVTK